MSEHAESFMAVSDDDVRKSIRKVGNLINYTIPPVTTVLDIGCGDGELFKTLYMKNKIGIDPYTNLVTTDFTFYHDSIDQPLLQEKLRKEKIELVVMNHSFEHFTDPYGLITNIKAVVLPNHYLCIVVPHEADAWAYAHPGHYTFWNERSLERFLQLNGYEVIYLEIAESHSNMREVRVFAEYKRLGN